MFRKQAACPGASWRVRAGDSLYLIARRNYTTVDRLLQLNPGLNPHNLMIGQLICLPPPVQPEQPPSCASGIYWTVAPGDTLYLIAKTMNTTVEVLLKLNPFVDPGNLKVDSNICLPG